MLRSQLADLRALIQPTFIPGATGDETVPTTALFSATDENGIQNIYQTNPLTGRTRPLTQMPPNVSASQPALSPDGSKIAYTRETREFDEISKAGRILSSEVWLMDRNGTNQQRILPSYPLARSAAWSPDGAWLALEVAENDREWRDHDIVLVNIANGAQRALVTSPRWEGGPTWSPDGSYIAFHARRDSKCMEIFAVGLQNSAAERQITDLSENDCDSQSSGDYWPDWSTRGIALGRKLAGKEQIVVVDYQTRQETVLDTGELPAGHPNWSTDGRHILFEQGKLPLVALARYDLESKTTTPVETALAGAHLADWN
jgi:Tol biopolymer transport system component